MTKLSQREKGDISVTSHHRYCERSNPHTDNRVNICMGMHGRHLWQKMMVHCKGHRCLGTWPLMEYCARALQRGNAVKIRQWNSVRFLPGTATHRYLGMWQYNSVHTHKYHFKTFLRTDRQLSERCMYKLSHYMVPAFLPNMTCQYWHRPINLPNSKSTVQ